MNQRRDRAEFGRLVTDVLAYYRQDASRFTLDIWWSACEPFDLEQVRKAMTAHATDPERGQFAPKVADIVRQLAGTQTDRAQLAWGKVLEAMQSIGAYTDVVFDDPAVHAAVEDMGGWPKLCRTPLTELGLLQHRFCQAHRAYTASGEFPYPRRLMGDRSPDGEWERKGLAPPRPVLIGDPGRAAAVWQGGTLAGKTPFTTLSHEAMRALSSKPIKLPRAALAAIEGLRA